MQDEDILEDNKVLYFSFVPMEQPYNSNIASPIPDMWGSHLTKFSFIYQCDADTLRRFSFDDLVENNFADPSDIDMALLPYKVEIYADNVKIVGDKIAAVETSTMTVSLMVGWWTSCLLRI